MRRRAVLLIVAMTVCLVAAAGVALAASITCPNSIGNLCVGTDEADTMTGTNQGDDMRGRGGGDTMYVRGGDDKALGGDGNDDISAGPGNDPSVRGGPGDDSLSGGDGDDAYVFGDSWDGDTITTGETSGEDALVFSSLLEPLDVDLVSSAGRDEVFSDAGVLNFPATVGIENVRGGEARDVVRGNEARNHFSGNAGNDSLVGRGNDDVLSGGVGADSFNGGPGNDVLNGGDGIDGDVYLFEDGWGQDRIDSDAAGTDRLFFGGLTSSVTVDLAASDTGVEASSGANTVDWPSTVALENATGGPANDILRGDDSGNTLNGQGGDDKISGRGGIDKVSGDAPGLATLTGDDTIDVADGDPGDTVDCGPGTDTVDVDAISGPSGTIRIDTDIKENCETVNEVLIN
jgi:Ca2+-binding RTX toxin-like protein